MVRKNLVICLYVAASLSLAVRSTYGRPLELLVNGSFLNGLQGWTSLGLVYPEKGYVRIDRYGSITQTVERQDLSPFLELSYEVCTVFRVLGSHTSYARSIITYYVADTQGSVEEFAIVGKYHDELGGSFPNFQTVKIDLWELFHRNIGLDQACSLKKVKVTLELGFNVNPPYTASAYFKNVSMKRCNPVKLVVHQHYSEFPDRTEFFATIMNLGDLDAFDLSVRLDLSADVLVISEPITFERYSLEGGSSWQVSWVISARYSGNHSITVHVKADQTGTELSTSIPVRSPRPTTTQTAIQTVTSIQTVTTKIIALSVDLLVLIILMAGVVVAAVIYAHSRQRKRRL